MIRRLAFVSLLAAWLCANGAVWNVAQAFAWSRMFAGYARTLSVGAALRETFDPAKPCPLCRAVQKARADQEGRQPAAAFDPSRLDLAHEPAVALVLARPAISWPRPHAFAASARREPVPLPPPRG
ncbi:MAG TPA: hypothetical protein VHD62_04745 [Opitutaceae bacterium]|nr:hypothetical protein [Opitutaceae bacterium]